MCLFIGISTKLLWCHVQSIFLCLEKLQSCWNLLYLWWYLPTLGILEYLANRNVPSRTLYGSPLRLPPCIHLGTSKLPPSFYVQTTFREITQSAVSTYVLLCWSSYSEFSKSVCWLLINTSRKANYSKQDATAVPFKSYHILFPTVSTQSSMLSIFHASCCISLISWCTLFSWRGRSSGPEAVKEECGMGKSE